MSKGYDSKEHQQGEIHAIQQTITEIESAFNAHDADELDRHLTLNAIWISVLGKRLPGWKQINETHKILLAGPLRDSYACYAVESINFVLSDVAIAHIKQYSTTSEGKIIEGKQGSLAIYVMVKEKETWKIAAGQNTLIQALPHIPCAFRKNPVSHELREKRVPSYLLKALFFLM